MKFLQVDSLSVAEDKGILSQNYNFLTTLIVGLLVIGLFLILRRIVKDKAASKK